MASDILEDKLYEAAKKFIESGKGKNLLQTTLCPAIKWKTISEEAMKEVQDIYPQLLFDHNDTDWWQGIENSLKEGFLAEKAMAYVHWLVKKGYKAAKPYINNNTHETNTHLFMIGVCYQVTCNNGQVHESAIYQGDSPSGLCFYDVDKKQRLRVAKHTINSVERRSLNKNI